jgi:hypothetical protein
LSVEVEKRRETLQYISRFPTENILDRRSLLNISLPNSAAELKDFLRHLDHTLKEKALEWARQCYKAILERVDEAFAQNRDKQLEIEHRREVWYQTCLGAVKIKRRQYADRQGQRCCLLDSVMGMDRHDHTTAKVQGLALEMASFMPYRRSAEVLQKAAAIDLAHQTIWRLVGKAADPYLAQEEQELKWFMETGEIPRGENKRVSRLLVEADGVILSLQREKERRAEVKLGIAYEGWQRVGKDRYRTTSKTAFSSIAGENVFWSGLTLKLHKTYDLAGVSDTIVGGDGAGWIKAGAEYIGGRFQLDRYHLNRELCAAFGRDNQIKRKVWEACERGDVASGLEIIIAAMKQARGESALRMARAYHYIEDNRAGIGDYRLSLGSEGYTLRRTGAMEGNIDKLIVRRMKNQGMSWSLEGIRRLLCVRFLILEKKLTSWLEREKHSSMPPRMTLPKKKTRRIVTKLSIQEPDEWIKAKMPALYGPHASHPWVKMLKSLSEAGVL